MVTGASRVSHSPSPFPDYGRSVLPIIVAPGTGTEQFDYFLVDEFMFSSHRRGGSIGPAGISLGCDFKVCSVFAPWPTSRSPKAQSMERGQRRWAWRLSSAATLSHQLCLQRPLLLTF